MPRIPEEIIERVKEATDIVELVSEHVQLAKRGGSSFFGLCPFHKENTPSFSVNADRQIYHCFGCGASGNVFKFLQEIDRISFVEAVAFLAQRGGIALPDRAADREQGGANDQLYQANELAQKYYHHLLLQDPDGRTALDYVRRRGLADATIERFGLGYAPPAWDGLLKVALRRGLDPQLMERAGLALPRQSGSGYYDRFRNRVAFPIANPSGRTIAFGARALLPDQEPKYLNSPETSVYRKSAVLYGLDRTRDDIRRAGVALIVEGYMDLLSLVQAGIPNVVASAGTALTEEQCRLLGRHARRVVLLFDGDAAGSAAAMRGVEVLLSTGLDAGVVSLPEEHDPDTFVQQQGAQALQALVQEAQSVLDFYLRQLGLRHDLGSLPGKTQALESFKPLLIRTRDPVRRDLLLREVTQRLGVDERAMRQELQQEARSPRAADRARTGAPPPAPQEPPGQEMEFLGLLLNHPRFIAGTARQLDPEAFVDSRCQTLARLLFERYADAAGLDVSLLVGGLEDQALVQLVCVCAMRGFDEAHVEQQWEDSVRHFRTSALTRRIEQLRQQLADASRAGDTDASLRLSAEHQRLVLQRRELAAQQNP
jgi:DNA primase